VDPLEGNDDDDSDYHPMLEDNDDTNSDGGLPDIVIKSEVDLGESDDENDLLRDETSNGAQDNVQKGKVID